MEVPPDAARGRGVPIAHPDRIGYDSKENQQAYNSITHGSPDNQIDVAKHFMKLNRSSRHAYWSVEVLNDCLQSIVIQFVVYSFKKSLPGL